MGYIMSLPPDDFLDLLTRAAEEKRREELRQQWLVMLPWMKEPKPFEQFYQDNTKHIRLASSRRSAEAIIADAEAIRHAAK